MPTPSIPEEEILGIIEENRAGLEACEPWGDPVVCAVVVVLAVLLAAIVVILVHNRVRRTGDPGGRDLTTIVAAVGVIAVLGVVYMVWCLHCDYLDHELWYDNAVEYWEYWYNSGMTYT